MFKVARYVIASSLLLSVGTVAQALTAHVTGNAATNIACNAATTVTAGAIEAAGGVPGLPYTNCTN